MRVEIELTDKLKEYVDDYIDIGGGDNVFCYPDNIIKAIREGIERQTGDLIEREAAINALLEHEDEKGFLHGDFEEILNELPSVAERQTGEWITTDKQLPEVGQRVLVSYSIDTEKKVAITIYDKVGFAIGFVDAWMPLPEPYKVTE